MKVYKEKQFLIFDFEDGRTVKYDFSQKLTIGIRGKIVKDLRGQLKDLTFESMIDAIEDKNYGRFLKYVKNVEENINGSCITNIGTILNRVPKYGRFEQLFSAGLNITSGKINATINDIPKGLAKISREHFLNLSDNIIYFYKKNPDWYNLAYKMEFMTLNSARISRILFEGSYTYSRGTMERNYYTYFGKLIEEYGYTTKPLLLYIDHLCTYEALDDVNYILRELIDYARMMSEISAKFERYPRHFLTSHKIASRNYTRLKHIFDEQKFKKSINLTLECKIDGFDFIYPKCTQDIKDEAVSQNNCVASYIKDVLEGSCHILFMRHADEPNKSYITLEVRNNKIVQAKRKFNEYISSKEQLVVDKWNKKYENKKEEVA